MDRGNFGYILGGKLKVKLHEKDELTKQYDVALKILKTKVDKEEHLAETEENIKGTFYLEKFWVKRSEFRTSANLSGLSFCVFVFN